MNILIKIQKNLSRYMLVYTILAIVLWLLVWKFTHISLWKYILVIVFFLIYPTMVNLSLKSFKKVKDVRKSLFTALLINFVFTPILMWLICYVFHVDPLITFWLVLLAVWPASSMWLWYIWLSGGNMLSWSIIAWVAFLLSILIYPLFFHFALIWSHFVVPTAMLLKNLVFVLVIPLVLWILTREYIERKYKNLVFNDIKPIFWLVSLIALYVLIFSIFESKANVVITHWKDIFHILLPVLFYYIISILAILYINKNVLKLEYWDHQSVVFTSVAKNIALTIAILISILWDKWVEVAIYIVMMSLIQPIVLMIYLKNKKRVRTYFDKNFIL